MSLSLTGAWLDDVDDGPVGTRADGGLEPGGLGGGELVGGGGAGGLPCVGGDVRGCCCCVGDRAGGRDVSILALAAVAMEDALLGRKETMRVKCEIRRENGCSLSSYCLLSLTV